MNLTYSLIGRKLIKLLKLLVWGLKYLACIVCSLLRKLVCNLTSTLDNLCEVVTRKACGWSMCCCFFMSKKTKNRVTDVVVEFVCCWVRVLTKILETFEKTLCELLPNCYFHVLDYFVAVVVLVLTWVTKTVDAFVTWVMCLTYLNDGVNKLSSVLNGEERLLTLAPTIVVDKNGYSDWFVYFKTGHCGPENIVTSPDTYIMGTNGEKLVPYKVDENKQDKKCNDKCSRKRKINAPKNVVIKKTETVVTVVTSYMSMPN